MPALDLIFTGTFLAIARYFGAASYAIVEYLKTKLKAPVFQSGFFPYFFAILSNLGLVAALKYGVIAGVQALLATIGFVVPVPELPGGVQPNVYYLILAVVSLFVSGTKFLKKSLS